MGNLSLLMALLGCAPEPIDIDPIATTGDTPTVTAPQSESLPVEPVPTTWNDGIGEIFQENCVRCHSQDQLGTYRPLSTYDEVVAERFSIYSKLLGSSSGSLMPPAPNGETETCHPENAWQNDLRLPTEDTEAVLAWIEDGTPRGTGAGPVEPLVPPATPQLADATTHPFVDGYTVSIDSSYNMKDEFVCVIIDPAAAGASGRISGLQPDVDDVHLFKGMQVRIDAARESLALTTAGSPRAHGSDWYECADGFGFSGQLLTSFIPESGPFETPAGTSIDLPKGALLVYRTHYHSHYDQLDPDDNSPLPPLLSWEDHTGLLVRWEHGATHPVTLVTVGATNSPVVEGQGLATGPFEIPAQGRDHVEIMRGVIPGGSKQKYAVAFSQNLMGEAGTRAELRLDSPIAPSTAIGGECIAANPDGADAWQLPVIYNATAGRHPLARGGDSLLLQCVYDNPGETPVLLGTTPSDELCEAVVGLVAAP